MSTRVRRALWVAFALLSAELVFAIVSGSVSWWPPFGGVGLTGFTLRALALAALMTALRFRPLPLWLLLLPALAHFHLGGGRIGGDGVMYYVQLRSLLKDADIDLTNEYTHYELIDREDLRVRTKTGLRRSIFAIGPALAWAPFFAAGEAVARVERAAGRDADLSGYGPAHVNATALGSFAYGFAALLLIHDLLRRHFTPGLATAGVVLLWAGSFLHWYMVHQPTMSHAPSAFGAALVIWLWDRTRGTRTTRAYLGLGLALGFAMCLRWQNGVLLVLPGFDLAAAAWRRAAPWRALATGAAALGAGALVGALPQMVAWNALYGMWLLPYPPHGTDFVRLDHPYVRETLFSSRHGLLSWTPLMWLGFAGFVPLLRRRPALAAPLLVPLVLMTYVNMCSGDWWAGGSFSIRRFDPLLAPFALGIAACLEWAGALVQRRPQVALAAAALPIAVWNAGLWEQVRRGLVPREGATTFPRVYGQTARIVADGVGSPSTWPASWIFALREGRPPSQYDPLVGRYLFYRQNNLEGLIDVGGPGDEAMLGEGWGRVEECFDTKGRRTDGPARVFAPLDVPEALVVSVTAAAPRDATEVRLSVNGRDAGRFAADRTLREHSLTVGAEWWHRELNSVRLDSGALRVYVDRVRFARAGS
ncbi:MAG TPA: hypothetical protein VFQ51_17345 [Vicinamibacteria bacterium]|nr:hypothetical protein [Vicinamibacteria bacterium]